MEKERGGDFKLRHYQISPALLRMTTLVFCAMMIHLNQQIDPVKDSK